LHHEGFWDNTNASLPAERDGLVASAHDAIVVCSLDGIVCTWNAAAARMFGYAAVEIIGSPLTTLIPPDRQHERVVNFSRVHSGETVKDFQTFRVRKDGSVFPISMTLSPILLAGESAPTGVLFIGRALTNLNLDQC
jgi:PAS domain S-box-containing protein